MNSEIYINQSSKELELTIFKHFNEKRQDMIWMDNGVRYYTSKMTTKKYQKFGLLQMLWPAQSLDLPPIENLWRIIKIKVNTQRQRIHSLEEMQRVIQEE